MTNLIGVAEGGRTGAGSFTVTPPAGAAAYIAVLTIGTDAFPDPGEPSGFTLIASDHSDAFSSWYMFSGVPGAGDVWSIPSGWSASLLIYAYDTAAVLDQPPLTAANSQVSPSITTSVPCLVMRVQTGNPWPNLAVVGFPPSTINQQARQDPTTDDPDDHSMVAIAMSVQGAAGATGTATWTTEGNDSQSAHTIVIRNVATPPAGGFAGAFTFGPAAADGEAPPSGSGFLTSVAFGPAAASGETDVAGGFAAAFNFGPATASGPVNARYIQGISANGRYFVDQAGQPILVKGDSPWSAFVDLSVAEWELWCADRESRGFNAAIVSVLGNPTNGGPSANGATYDGIQPFTGAFVPNETYWARIDQFVSTAAAHGITLFLYAADGWVTNPSDSGVIASMNATQAQAYGAWIATRYASAQNIMWMGGGDFDPRYNPTGETIHHAVLAGIRSVDPAAPYGMQMIYQRTYPGQYPTWRDEVAWEFLYTRLPPYELIWEVWALSPAKPALFAEGVYALMYGNQGSATRKQAGWALSSASPGEFYGTDDWSFSSGWQSRLGQDTTVEVAAMRAFVEATEWWKVEPAPTFITSGAGTVYTFPFANDPDDPPEFVDDPAGPNASVDPPTLNAHAYGTAAVAYDGSLAIVYLPTQRTISLDLTQLGENPVGTWFNAITGATSSANLAGLTPPASGDWLLVVEADPLVLPAGDFASSFSFGPAVASGAVDSEGGFSTSFSFGPAEAGGSTPSAGGFGSTFTYGPASAEGESVSEGGFASAVAFGPAVAAGETEATGAFASSVSFGPAEAGGGSDVGGDFAAAYGFGPAIADGEIESEGGFATSVTFGPAVAEGASGVPAGGFGTSYAFGPATAEGDRPSAGGFAGAFHWGPAGFAGGLDPDLCWPSPMLLTPVGAATTLMPQGPLMTLVEDGCRP